ncbi:MAG: Fe-S cluster assembly protein SufD [Gammaproteobacteria bacterium]|nr:Fe-S cluster assembly protein SufD [Gammaproteobacteria bacterium]
MPYYKDSTVVVFVNGAWKKLSKKNGSFTNHGVNIQCLREWKDRAQKPFLRYFDRLANKQDLALVNGGCGIFLPACHKATAPIHLFFYSEGESVTYYPRVLVIAEEKSQVTLVEHYVGGASKGSVVHGVSEIYVGKGARVAHTQLFYEESRTVQSSSVWAKQDEDSQFTSFVLSMGGERTKQELTVNLSSPGATCTLNGLYLVGACEEACHHTKIEHNAPFCESKEVYRGVVGKHGKANFNGKIVVEEGAIKSRASLVNKNLMLCEESEINTKPELEIYNDDVVCTHGATVGQLDEQALFYFRSRGIEPQQAKKLLVSAFVNEEMKHIPAPILPLIEKKKENFFEIGT